VGDRSEDSTRAPTQDWAGASLHGWARSAQVRGGDRSQPFDRPAILLVDDHRENLNALEAVLQPLGERLISVESGEQALRALLRDEIAVILLDVRMAGLDGVETARIVRSRPATRHIPIVFLTAQMSDVSEITLAYATGAVDYVVKPFEPAILRAKVAAFVELSRERAERIRQSRALAHAEAVTRAVRTLQALSDVALNHLELEPLADELLDRACSLFNAETAALLLADEHGGPLRVNASRGDPLPLPPDGRVIPGEGAIGSLLGGSTGSLLSREDLVGRISGPGAPVDPSEEKIASLLAIPLASAGRTLGLLLLGSRDESGFDSSDLELLGLAADRIAIAIDHAQRFAHGREVVETLQHSLLPERLPRHPRLELAARYLPGVSGMQIGGDWYDALQLDGDRLALMIGDVVGHGLRAAATMGELRNALRAFAVEGHSPSEALQQLDRLAQTTAGQGMVATVAFLVLNVTAQAVTVARAGHPPPMLRTADGEVRLLDTAHTLPLGVDRSASPSEATYRIGPGDTLLLYTDGLIERRGETITAGVQRLCDEFSAAPEHAEGLCRHVVERLLGEHPSSDDAALLAVRLLGVPADALRLTLDARPDSLPLARHRLRAWLADRAPELDPTARADLEVAFSEACTNVVRHAYQERAGTFEATASRATGTIELEVRDRGQWRHRSAADGGHGLPLIHALCDDVVVDRREGGTTVRMRRAIC
jgi:serine phosphatase RsbU (regulator of sigma subunit)/DNA-binding response OmpR family regulator/anti-sigma regulatory factor (Ser/Thr protein kinase)